jgi:hypothetical protein
MRDSNGEMLYVPGTIESTWQLLELKIAKSHLLKITARNLGVFSSNSMKQIKDVD